MNRLSDAVIQIVAENPALDFVFRERLLNLTQAAAFLKPLIEARLKKSVTRASITMALSRYQRATAKNRGPRGTSGGPRRFRFDNLFVTPGLGILTYENSTAVRRTLEKAFSALQRKGSFIAVTQGAHQVTVTLDRRELQKVIDEIAERPLVKHAAVSGIAVSFAKEYGKMPGLFAEIFQQLYLQSINVVECASTATELILYLHDDDVRLAFDTLFNRFVQAPQTSY